MTNERGTFLKKGKMKHRKWIAKWNGLSIKHIWVHSKCPVQTDGKTAQVMGIILWIVPKHLSSNYSEYRTFSGCSHSFPFSSAFFSFIDTIPSFRRRGIRFQTLEYMCLTELCTALSKPSTRSLALGIRSHAYGETFQNSMGRVGWKFWAKIYAITGLRFI